MKKVFVLFLSYFLFIIPYQGITQEIEQKEYTDSLWSVWNNPSQSDTNRLKALDDIIWEVYIFSQPDSAFYFAQIQYEFASKKNLKKQMSSALNSQGISFTYRSNYPKAIEYHTKSLKISEEIGYMSGIAASLSNIGVIYKEQGDYTKAIEYYTRGLKINKEIGKLEGVSSALTNIGIIYKTQGNYTKAIEYYKRSMAIDKESGNKRGIAILLINIGSVETKTGNYIDAIEYFKKSLKLQKEMGNNRGVVISLINIGEVYRLQKKYKIAISFLSNALAISNEHQFLLETKGAAENLYKSYKATGNFLKALKMHELYITTGDSLMSERNQKEIIRQEYKYAYEKQAAADSVKNVETKKVKDAQLTAEKAKNVQQKQRSYFLYGLLAMVVMFGGYIFSRFRLTRKQKAIIEKQKEQVDEAFDELEEKNTEIMDSINYAKRIQSAILPSDKVVKEYLQDSFILYKPKDIVAGDFYWMETVSTELGRSIILFAAADCTGHGVPGAMVSVVCNNALNRSVKEFGLSEPGKILDKAREIVIQEFEKSDDEVKDGMDIALCSLEGNQLKYAGAHNPLWIIRKGEIIETKANKQPIGKFDNPKPYTTHLYELQKGDTIYIFSDGYADQFGGYKGKKFKSANFKKLLISLHDKSMDHQKIRLEDAFENWRGENEQIDDVCVIGVKI